MARQTLPGTPNRPSAETNPLTIPAGSRSAWSRSAIGVDIGGTKILAGLVQADGQVVQRSRWLTPNRAATAQEVEDLLVEIIDELSRDQQPVAIGIGAAGFIDQESGTVRFAPHLSWRNEPLRQRIWRRVRVPVVLENDANAALWAEARFGAGRGLANAIAVNVGTGIGGAILIRGRLFRGQYGMAGEFGHMQCVVDGRPCECGKTGCWEQYASGNALVRRARALLESADPRSVALADRVAGDAFKISGPVITQLAEQGDPAGQQLISETGYWLGLGLANLAAAFDPASFIIGGGVSEAGELLLGPARTAFAEHLSGNGFRPVAQGVGADLGNSAGLIGAADLARRAARRGARWRKKSRR